MAKRSQAAKAPDLAAIAAAAEPAPAPVELGPPITEDFADAVGLSQLKGSRAQRDGEGRSAAPSAPPAAAPAPLNVDWAKMVQQQLELLDVIVSKVLGVEPEPKAHLESPAQAMTPWITVHMADAQSETALRFLALSGLVAFVGMKVVSWAEMRKRKLAEQQRNRVATPPDDLDIPEPVKSFE